MNANPHDNVFQRAAGDAAHIVRCVNAHDDLLAALSGVLAAIDKHGVEIELCHLDVAGLRAALAKAGAA